MECNADARHELPLPYNVQFSDDHEEEENDDARVRPGMPDALNEVVFVSGSAAMRKSSARCAHTAYRASAVAHDSENVVVTFVAGYVISSCVRRCSIAVVSAYERGSKKHASMTSGTSLSHTLALAVAAEMTGGGSEVGAGSGAGGQRSVCAHFDRNKGIVLPASHI